MAYGLIKIIWCSLDHQGICFIHSKLVPKPQEYGEDDEPPSDT
jgi:hypothetical protein